MRVLRRTTDAESGQRGYLLTGRSEYLAPYRDASVDIADALRTLDDLYRRRGDTASRERVKILSADLATKFSELREVIAMADAGRPQTARELVLSGIGRDRMDSIRLHVDALIAAETRRIEGGLINVTDTLLLSRVGIAAMTVISLLVLGMFLRQGRQLNAERREQQALMQAERDRLEGEVLARTAELTELARHLETAREDERARLARDLHDELGALLTTAKLDVARMRPKLQQALPDLMPRVVHLIEVLNAGIALKRRIIEDLRPSTLDNLGLLPALEVLCSEFADRLVPVHTHFEPVTLAPSADLTVFRLVQESLNNIAKHAQASEVHVTVAPQGDVAVISVQDNGRGFNLRQTDAGRHGLVGMRYRIEAEHGQLSLRSEPGQGTTLSARLPLQPARQPRGEALAAEAEADASAAASTAASGLGA
ncbi:MAG: CHASE3 domain-containing protein [Burkholderiales bacterium]